ncbi:DUF294 nucleotidyltransferase-like domain-containing protein [Pontivivens ytuae]|uniref:Cyclic nucleotide-binding/CBS domain-containing protein n=1 Tax=Pontivivens ytuae TaxID=2789856 RepID=A0A7S9LS24_9RHOB|nr:DUF294 nucleotidyltransferase-like domain-containing protein [Pontivivens ytuae]QPH54177.1 cyclic nucleotide-binding/CBS domain-containing protein [Pontivivens ytuae]
MADASEIATFLSRLAPYSNLTDSTLVPLAAAFERRHIARGDTIYSVGERLDGLYVICDGAVRIDDASGEVLSHLRAGNSFGERGLMQDGIAPTSARATAETDLLLLPAGRFRALVEADESFRDFYARNRAEPLRRAPTLAETRVETLMHGAPLTTAPDTTIAEAARMMRDAHVSSLMIVEGEALAGIITTRDLAGRVVAEGLETGRPVREIMTADPLSLPPDAIGSDVLNAMMERGIGHIPITQNGAPVGIITQTDLTRFQADSSATLIGDIAAGESADALAAITARIPRLLVQLVASGNRHEVVTRLITDITDAVTRRLLKLAEAELGPPPAPYLWLACGSQGRQEQTGVSDQDNCMILDDGADPNDPYFAELARRVSDGLDRCGYFYCPGDMMATNPRWRQPLSVWRSYFQGWIDKPDPMAQMLASVMFDLRPIGGTTSLFNGLQAETLAAASKNSIFVAHMVSNSLKHHPPLSLLRGIATARSGAHRNRVDLKLNGVVPVVDLGRVYALRGQLTAANTRARLVAARESGVVSQRGGQDLIDAYDLIAMARLEHQASRIRAGEAPDNYLPPKELSEFERSHLRDAFVVVRSMQSAATQGQGVL